MDGNSCVINLIEIVPVVNFRNCSESFDVKFNPCHIKVCILFIYYNFFFTALFRNVTITLLCLFSCAAQKVSE